MGDEGLEIVAAWMTKYGYATGHGDTIDQLLRELVWQVKEKQAREFKRWLEQQSYQKLL